MTVIVADCREGMSWFEPDSIDAIVTDPPYELGFMGRHWDSSGVAYDINTWKQALRVLKPGGHILAFGGTRTYHRMACAIEDAGFEIRDSLMWVYSSGFPKSHNLAPAIDKMLGAMGHRGKGFNTAGLGAGFTRPGGDMEAHKGITPEAQQWQGWGTALKPAFEPLVLARKPLRGTVAANVLAYGTGAINVDGCRVGTDVTGWNGLTSAEDNSTSYRFTKTSDPRPVIGRWPANLIHDGSEEVVGMFPAQDGRTGMRQHGSGTNSVYGAFERTEMSIGHAGIKDSGSAARFFYCSKASRSDRDEGLDDFPVQRAGVMSGSIDGSLTTGNGNPRTPSRANTHTTVKPTDLMRYLCRLITPPGGTILDPFAGSGSTGKAAMLEGFEFVGFELSEEYAEIANARIEHARKKAGR